MSDVVELKRLYTCTSINNTCLGANGAAGTKNVALSKFVISGDTDDIGQITYMRFRHYHTTSNTGYMNTNGVKIRTNLLCGSDTISSPYQTWNTFNTSGPINKWDVFDTLPTAEQFAALTHIQLQWGSFNKNTSLYYRAQTSAQMVLEVRYIASDAVGPSGIVRYRNSNAFINTQPFVFADGAFKRCLPYYYDGSKWVEIG